MDQSLFIFNMIATGLLAIIVVILAWQLYNKKINKNNDFIAIASHQLRTPLTIIKGYISMILEGQLGEVKEEKVKAALAAVYQANERLIHLTDNLLEVSQLEDQEIHINLEKFNFADVARETVEEMRPKAASKNLSLTITLPQEDFLIFADELMLRQVLINLLDNATKYTSQGGITLSAAKDNNKLLVSIIDTGPGLEIKDLNGLFGRFARRNILQKNQESFGLGLYVCKLIIEAHHGKIWAETRGGNFGFKVSFEIPCL
jgi:signal transduction histidine kinase